MTNFLVFPKVDGNHVFPPEVRQAIADSPEVGAKLDELEARTTTAPGGTVITDTGAFKLNDSSRPVVPLAEIACWGHSMMYSDGGIVSNGISAALGVPTYNLGIGGNTSTDIAIRAGGVIPLVTFSSGTIPADTSSVPVFVSPDRESLIAPGGNPFTYAGTVAGVPGSLVYATSTQTWSFNRNTAGTATPVAAMTPFLITSPTYHDRVAVVWPGRNNLYSQSHDMRNVCRDVDAMVGALTPYFKRYVVLADITASSETRNTTIYKTTIASNLERASRYGDSYYDLRRDFIDKGLGMAGITATTADTTAIAGDAPPPSLMNPAGDHPNSAGYTVIGTLISKFIGGKSWGFVYAGKNLLSTDAAMLSAIAWGPYGDGDVTALASTDLGEPTLKVTAAPSGVSAAALSVSSYAPVTPGLFYAVSVQSRAVTIGRSRFIEYYWYDANKAYLDYSSGGPTTDNTTGWTNIQSASTKAPANAAFLRVSVSSSGASSGEVNHLRHGSVTRLNAEGAMPPAWEMP